MLAGRLFCFPPSKRSSQPTLSKPFVHVLRSLISSHSFSVIDAGVVFSYSRTGLTNPRSLRTSPPRLGLPAVKLPPTAVMVDKIMLSFLLLDFLFVASGGLLIATVFINKASMATQPTTTNVAADMLLMQTPLTGNRPLIQKLAFANVSHRCNRQRRPNLRYLPHLPPRRRPLHQPPLAQTNRLDDRRHRTRHAPPRRQHLVLHTADPREPRHDIRTAVPTLPKPDPAEVSVLWLSQQPLHAGQRLHERLRGSAESQLRGAVQQLRQ